VRQSYREGCKGCGISSGRDTEVNERGGIIDLGNDWTVNHYGGPEGFLGWVVLQPRLHVGDMADLSAGEAASMGKSIRCVGRALREYWRVSFNDDPIERVYVMYFHESVFGIAEQSQLSQDEWHLHLHLIPRTVRLGRILRRFSDNGSIHAWSMPDVVRLSGGDFPKQYHKNNGNMSALISHLRLHLDRDDIHM